MQTIVTSGSEPKLGADAFIDVALVFRGLQLEWSTKKSMKAWLGEIHRTLKPKGTLGIEQHRAKDDANPEVAPKRATSR